VAQVISNLPKIEKELEKALMTAGEIIGGLAESYAKQSLTDSGAVDTGRLRNSVAHGMAGGKLSVNEYTDKSGNVVGDYGGGDIPKDATGKKYVVVVGSNVSYASFIELGTKKMSERPYLRPSIENHKEDYKEVLKEILKG